MHLRKLLNMNAEAFASAAGTTESELSQWESGRSLPSQEAFFRLAKLANNKNDKIEFLVAAGLPREDFDDMAHGQGGLLSVSRVVRLMEFLSSRQ